MNRIPFLVQEEEMMKKKNIWYHDDIYDFLMGRSSNESHIESFTTSKILSIIDHMIETLSERNFYKKNKEKLRKALTIQVMSTLINYDRGIQALHSGYSKYMKKHNLTKLSDKDKNKLKKEILDTYTEKLGHLRVYQNRSAFFTSDLVEPYKDHLTYEIQQECINIMVKSGLFTLKTGYYNPKKPKESKMSEIHVHKEAQKNVLNCIPPSFRESLLDEELWILQILFAPNSSFKELMWTYPWGQIEIQDLQGARIEEILGRRKNFIIENTKKGDGIERRQIKGDYSDLELLDNKLFDNLGQIYKHKQVLVKSGNTHTHGRYYSALHNVSKDFRNSFAQLTGKTQLDFTASLNNFINLLENGCELQERPYHLPYQRAYEKKVKAKKRKLKNLGFSFMDCAEQSEIDSAMVYIGNKLKKVYLAVNNTDKKSLSRIFYSESLKSCLIVSDITIAKELYRENPLEYKTLDDAITYVDNIRSTKIGLYSQIKGYVRNTLLKNQLIKEYGDNIPFDPANVLHNYTFTFKNFYNEFMYLNKASIHYMHKGISNDYMMNESMFMINTVRDIPSSVPLMMVHDEFIVKSEHSNMVEKEMEKNRVRHILNLYKSTTSKVDEYLYKNSINEIRDRDLRNLFKILPSEFEQSILYKYLVSLNIKFIDRYRSVREFLNKYKNSNSNINTIINNLKNLLNSFLSYWEKKKLRKKVNIFRNICRITYENHTYPIWFISNTVLEFSLNEKPPPI